MPARIDRTASVAADEAVANIQDAVSRKAMMALRTESYALFNATSERFDEVLEELRGVGEKIELHVATCAAETKSDEQWKQSAQRIYAEQVKRQGDHEDADEKFQKGQARWLIGVLLAALGSSWLAIAAFVWEGLKHS